MMENLYWWGVPTLFRCEHDADPEQCDIGLVGVPHSAGNGTTGAPDHHHHPTQPMPPRGAGGSCHRWPD